jgi:flagellin
LGTDATATLTGKTGAIDLGAAYGGLAAINLAEANLVDFSIGDELEFTLTNAQYGPNNALLVGKYGTTEEIMLDGRGSQQNASLLLEVISVDDVTHSVTFKATANLLNVDGSVSTKATNLTLDSTTRVLNSTKGDDDNLLGLDLKFSLGSATDADFKAGDKLAYNILANIDAIPLADQPAADAVKYIKIDGSQTMDWDDSWDSKNNSVTFDDRSLKYAIDTTQVNGREVHFRNFYINEDDGTVYAGDIILDLAKDFEDKISASAIGEGTVLASFEAAHIGQVAKGDVKLRDLDKFWNSEGRFLLQDAQKLTITQGDGKTATVTLYATDTLNDAATKLNQAIAKQLGQGTLLTVDGKKDPAANSFVTFVDEKLEGTSEATPGTFVIRSAIAGGNGEISFAGDEELVNALSLNEIKASEENSFTVSAWDAHSGKSVASSVKITGNKLVGVINENVDVVFDAMANVKVEWNEATKSFALTKDTGSYQTTLHLADNTTVYQIGANEGEDMGVNFGDMRAEALGLNSVLVTDRDSAARSITVIDNAIDKVSMQRAKIGAYQNRLEHTITNLTVAGENLTAAESRIRDTDMAKEMMNFTKLQIMLQAGTSMLAQANTLPQNVLSLLR